MFHYKVTFSKSAKNNSMNMANFKGENSLYFEIFNTTEKWEVFWKACCLNVAAISLQCSSNKQLEKYHLTWWPSLWR